MDIQKAERSIRGHLERLSAFTATPGAGVTRLPFTPPARAAADYLLEAMRAAGLEAVMDPSGAVSGIRRGGSEMRLILGSHYDSVPNGGAFDGAAGIACALAIAEQLAEEGTVPPLTLEVLATNDEEGVRFLSGYFTSKALTGELASGDLLRRDASGVSLDQAMKDFGLEPDGALHCARPEGSAAAYVEIHIEQGPVLEAMGREVGIVEGIVGIERYLVTLAGRADHAGTAPMASRQDALRRALRVVNAAYEAAESRPGTVATVGMLEVFPGAVNVVPERVSLSLDVRSADPASIEVVTGRAREAAQRACGAGGASFARTLSVAPTPMDAALTTRLEAHCARLGASTHRMFSGAGHDALMMARRMPAAMLFVPSKGGRSHCPEEWSDCAHLALAAAAVYDLVGEFGKEVVL